MFPVRTSCNPLNLDYAYGRIPDFAAKGIHRTTADPLIVLFKGDYILFSTNQRGYWWSEDLGAWHFVERSFLKPHHETYDDLCAPAAWVMGDRLFVIGSTYRSDFTIYSTSDARVGNWEIACENFEYGGWDPAFFLDDDGRLYLYHGSSNEHPIYGIEIDPQTFKTIGERQELIRLDPTQHGWERFGHEHDQTFLKPFIEGAWMNKHQGRYYLQYGAPGTEFAGYADGVYVSNAPLGPFEYQDHNPFALKPGGFANGSGHGGTFQDAHGNWWHISTMVIAVKNNFERRVGLWPVGFDEEGRMFCETAYGDNPYRLPSGANEDPKDYFTGWMLLNAFKPVTVSSTRGGFTANYAVDENIRTYWSAQSADPGEWIQSDLGEIMEVHAVQINYADEAAEYRDRGEGLRHRYRLWASENASEWAMVVDQSEKQTDTPHEYLELTPSITTRYLKLENVEVPTGRFALSGFRIFGRGLGPKPARVEHFEALRGNQGDRRNVWLRWRAEPLATGYLVRYGIAADRLYSSHLVYGASELTVRTLDRDRAYWFQIEAFNEAGISPRSEPILAP